MAGDLTNGLKVLVVDDEQDFCSLTKRILEKKGYVVEVAYGGEESITNIHDFNPGVVLLDVRMPRLGGDELVKMITVWKPGLPVIMVTANTRPEIREECLQNGAFECLNKPLDFDVLDKLINAAMERRKG